MSPAAQLHRIQDELVSSGISMDEAKHRLERVMADVEQLILEIDVMDHEGR